MEILLFMQREYFLNRKNLANESEENNTYGNKRVSTVIANINEETRLRRNLNLGHLV